MGVIRGSRDIPSLISALAATPDRLDALVRGVSDDALDAAPQGEWPARTVLAHLRDDEFMVTRLRLERMAVEHNPTLTPFDEKAWAASRGEAHEPADQLLAGFRVQREATVGILRRLQADDWRRTGLQPEYGEFDIHWWVEYCLKHDETHLAQIESALAKAG